jgi:protein TonB
MSYAIRRHSDGNALGIGIVVLLHLGVAYFLIAAFSPHFHPLQQPSTTVTVLTEPTKPEVSQPPQPFKVEPQPFKEVFVPIPDIIVTRSETPPIAKTTDKAPDAPQAVVALPSGPLTAPPPDTFAGSVPLGGAKLAYPAIAQAHGQQGWVDLDCTVDEAGRTSNCSVVDHLGGQSFVDAAQSYVAAARYRPATHNGVPVVEQHHRFHIEFKLSE